MKNNMEARLYAHTHIVLGQQTGGKRSGLVLRTDTGTSGHTHCHTPPRREGKHGGEAPPPRAHGRHGQPQGRPGGRRRPPRTTTTMATARAGAGRTSTTTCPQGPAQGPPRAPRPRRPRCPAPTPPSLHLASFSTSDGLVLPAERGTARRNGASTVNLNKIKQNWI